MDEKAQNNDIGNLSKYNTPKGNQNNNGKANGNVSNSSKTPNFDKPTSSSMIGNVGETALNNFLGSKNNGDSLGDNISNNIKEATKIAIDAGKAGAKAASGNVPGAVFDLFKNKKIRDAFVAVVLVYIGIVALICNSIPSPIQAPIEKFQYAGRVVEDIKDGNTDRLWRDGLGLIDGELPDAVDDIYSKLKNNDWQGAYSRAQRACQIVASNSMIFMGVIDPTTTVVGVGLNINARLQPYVDTVTNWLGDKAKDTANTIFNFTIGQEIDNFKDRWSEITSLFSEKADDEIKNMYQTVSPKVDKFLNEHLIPVKFKDDKVERKNTSMNLWGLNEIFGSVGIDFSRLTLNSVNDDIYASNVELNNVFDDVTKAALQLSIKRNLIDINSLNILHYSPEEYVQENDSGTQAPHYLKEAANNLTNTIGLIAQSRGLELKSVIDKDYAVKQKNNSGYITSKIISNQVQQSYSQYEALKLMCAYSIQTDNALSVNTFRDFLEWLGYGDKINKVKEDSDKYKKWNVLPEKPIGLLMSQKDYENIYSSFENATRLSQEDINSIKLTSAMAEVVYADPEISERTWSEEVYIGDDEEGNPQYETRWYKEFTYSIKTKPVDELVKEVIKFDEAVEKDENGTPNRLNRTTYKEQWYKEMCQSMMTYLGISGSGSGGGYGSGNSLVQVALNEVGYKEGSGNINKYGERFGSNGVAWCNWFVSWCAEEANIDSSIIPRTGYTGDTYEFYNALGLIHPADGSYEPKPGDLVLRGTPSTWASYGHIGIVEKLDTDKSLWTIEGNTGSNNAVINGEGQGVYEKRYEFNGNQWNKWTYYCEVPYPAGGMGGEFKCQGYALPDDKLAFLAALFQNEEDNPEYIGYIISHAVNMCEKWWNDGLYTRYKGDIYATMNANKAWWGRNWRSANSSTAKSETIEKIKSIICEGNRMLPPYVVEYDGFSEMYELYDSKQTYLAIDGQSAPNDRKRAYEICQNAQPGVSKVKGSFGGSGTFFGFTSDGINGNVYYYDESYKAKLGY